MADDFARQLLDALYNPETQPPQQPSRPLREKLAGAAETVGTLGSGLLASVPAGLAGLTQLIPTRGHRPSVNRAAEKVEEVQSALTRLPRTEAGQEYLEKTAGALGVLGMPAEFLGEQTLKLTGSPFLATAANVGLDPVNYIGMPGSGKAAVATGKALGRAAAAAPRVAGEMISDLVMPAPRAQAQRGAIDLGPQIPEFQPQTSLGLVSRADEALAALPRNKGTGAEFLRELEKTPGVRMAELEDRGLVEALSGMGKVTKADVIKALQDNPPVKFEEVVLGVKNPTRVEGRSLADASIAEDRKILEDAGIYPDLHPDSPDLLAFLNSADGDMVSAGELRQLVQNPEYPEVTQQVAQAAQNISDYYLGAESSKIGPTRYGRFTLPGGENYREMLLTLPGSKPSAEAEARLRAVQDRINELRPIIDRQPLGVTAERREFNTLYDERDRLIQQRGGVTYTSPHWDQPNVLAHARISDRTGPNGEKILHVEELQSDWHQAGRKRGYEKSLSAMPEMSADELLLTHGDQLTPSQKSWLRSFTDRWEAAADESEITKLTSEYDKWLSSEKLQGVPDAPFKKNWHELMMRRLVDYAAKNGYDRIAITPGAEQASRYDLSKQVDELLFQKNQDGTYKLSAQAGGRGNMLGEKIPENKLSDYVGKEVAEKIVGNSGKEINLGGSGSVSQPADMWRSLSGLDLKIGGEGMKGFYDKILPTYLNELGKPYGVKVGQMEIEIPGKEKRVLERIPGEIWSKSVQKPETFSAHSFDITPQMREAIKSKGLPLYAKGGSVHISDNLDTMALELQVGGAVAAARAAAKAAEKSAAKAKPVYPQAEALERARQNAVKMLNLPENNTPEMRAQAMGYIDYLHGTQRMDRLLEGKTLDPRRATSGPMPYGTTTPELASSYATSKADTSRRATDEGDVRRYFEVAPKDIGIQGLRSPLPVETAWHFMTPEQQAKIRELAPRVGYENLDEFTGNLIVHPEGVNGNLSANHWNWLMKNEAKGNPLTALRHMWYESGQLVHEPETLGQIYRLAGVDAPISQTKAPWTESQGVLLGKARITNPIDTSNTEQVSALIEPLKQAFARDRSRTKAAGPDQWAKDVRYTPRSWVSELEKDLAEGKESYVWTSIPDKVTAELRRLGFNGIIDRSGKGGGAKEPVVIPFDPAQVRSRFAAFDPAEMDVPDLLKATGGIIKAATKAAKPTAEQAATMAAQRAELVLRSRAMQELKDQFENLPQPPKGFLSPENILQRMDEIRRREATPSGEQIPLLKKGGVVEMQAGGALKAAAKAAERAAKAAKPEVLTAAERDANLAKMLQESKAKTRLYHGTKAQDEYADEPGQAFKQFASSPTWLAQEPYTAQGYAGGVPGSSIYQVYAQVKNPLNLRFDANEEASKAFPMARRLGVDVNHIKGMSNPQWAWEVVNHPSFIDAVEKAGYDAIMMNEGGYKTFGVLDPRRIKSATGNRGTFDVTNPDITKKRGGKVSITDNLDTMRLAVQKRK